MQLLEIKKYICISLICKYFDNSNNKKRWKNEILKMKRLPDP